MAVHSEPNKDRTPAKSATSPVASESAASGRASVGPVNPEMIKRHRLQSLVSKLTSPIWVGVSIFLMRFYFRYRIKDHAKLRAQYRRIRAQSDGPIVICGNHLTLVDSFLIEWTIGSWFYWITHPKELPWNTPERKNFGRTRFARLLIFIARCIPITRGGSREGVGDVLERVKYLLLNGETALLYPEAGRSRSGRVEEDSGAWGVGRVVGAVPGCRVLCVYLRGRQQETWGDFPAKRDVMDVSLVCIEPKSDQRGARRSRDIAQQVVRQLVRMEEEYFDARG